MRETVADLSGQGDWLGFANRPCHLDLVTQVRDVRLVRKLVALIKTEFESMIQFSLDSYYLL